jgi:enoyl-CoA hydratase/carnithine racemase
MSQKYEHLKIELPKTKPGGTIDGNYAVVSINRPDKLNSLQVQTVEEIANFLKSVEVDADIRCVVLRGVKEFTKKPAFSSGADLTSSFGPGIKPNIPMHMAIAMRMRMRYYDEIEQFTKPLIAAVDGFALGGGCELVLVCDIVIASKRSSFGFPEIERGILPGNGGCTRMARRIGLNRALRMTYFGEPISADQMLEWGLVSWVAKEGDEFENLVHQKAQWLGAAPTTALYVIKKCVKFGTQVPTEIGLHFEQLGFGVNSASSDVKEGIQAFIKKQKPQYKGM